MPASIATLLLIWSGLLPQGAAREPGPTIASASPSASHHGAIHALPPADGWPWRISEADTDPEEDDRDDGFGLEALDSSRSSRDRDPGRASPIRRDRGLALSPSRSPILRC